MAETVVGRFVKPDAAITHFHIREGDRVGDFGAGVGYFIPVLSKAVGHEGKVYACEIQKGLVDKLGALKLEKQLSNVEPLWCDVESAGGVKVADDTLDIGILINTLFLLEDKPTALAEMARTLRTGAKFFVIDWSESYGGMGPSPDHVVTESVAKKLTEEAGFTFERSFDAGGHHYGLAFRKS